jgi:GPI ethanolamine phosphate transferase membrane region
MYVGLAMLLASVVILVPHLYQSPLQSILKFEFLSVALSFGGMMFASSYVEEEQQFWYWIATTHFTFAFIQRCSSPDLTIDHSLRTKSLFSVVPYQNFLLQLPLLRIIRRWNQTGPTVTFTPLTHRPKIRRCSRYSKGILTTQPGHSGSARRSDLSPRWIHIIRQLLSPKRRLQKNNLANPPHQCVVALQNIHGRRSRGTTSHLASTYP